MSIFLPGAQISIKDKCLWHPINLLVGNKLSLKWALSPFYRYGIFNISIIPPPLAQLHFLLFMYCSSELFGSFPTWGLGLGHRECRERQKSKRWGWEHDHNNTHCFSLFSMCLSDFRMHNNADIARLIVCQLVHFQGHDFSLELAKNTHTHTCLGPWLCLGTQFLNVEIWHSFHSWGTCLLLWIVIEKMQLIM